jgi:hypothetical protein
MTDEWAEVRPSRFDMIVFAVVVGGMTTSIFSLGFLAGYLYSTWCIS